MKSLSSLVILGLVCQFAASEVQQTSAIPSGQNTPEGVACDAVQTFINNDAKGWLATLVRPIYGEEKNKEYAAFKKMMCEKIDASSKNPPPVKPVIIRCYKARQLSMNGPGSLAYSAYEFTGNMFVDLTISVGDKLQDLRYHVMQDKNGKWYFEPRPDLAQLLSMGLNRESPSTEVWTK